MAVCEALFLTCGDVVKRLRMGRTTLYRLSRKYAVFRPIRTEIGPRYHSEQLSIMESVLLKAISPAEADQRWSDWLLYRCVDNMPTSEPVKRRQRKAEYGQ